MQSDIALGKWALGYLIVDFYIIKFTFIFETLFFPQLVGFFLENKIKKGRPKIGYLKLETWNQISVCIGQDNSGPKAKSFRLGSTWITSMHCPKYVMLLYLI